MYKKIGFKQNCTCYKWDKILGKEVIWSQKQSFVIIVKVPNSNLTLTFKIILNVRSKFNDVYKLLANTLIYVTAKNTSEQQTK